MTDIISLVLDHIIELVFGIIGIIISTIVIPWLKEKKLYGTIKVLVEAAEKWAENNNINKLDYVIQGLEFLGIKVTDDIRKKIEAAVLELDIQLQQADLDTTKYSDRMILNESVNNILTEDVE